MVIGQFYFKRVTNGNLLGEFSNNHTAFPYTESADIINRRVNSGFDGTYNATFWEGNKGIFYKLIITALENEMFSLEWRDKNDVVKFLGQGFLVEGILIGHYRDTEVIITNQLL